MVVLYKRTSDIGSVNKARQFLFATGKRKIENIPPSQAALVQHIWRAVYQAGFVWGQSLSPCLVLPDPGEWGLMRYTPSDSWHPLWTLMPKASKGCRELIKCNCKVICSGRCKCTKANMECTQLCFCGGNCHAN